MTFDRPIFIIGAPRSGTTWVGKIFDSHPNVLYRHEPDVLIRCPSNVDPHQALRLLHRWSTDHSLRTNAKRPFFRKAWRPLPLYLMRSALCYLMLTAQRLTGGYLPPDTRYLADMGHTENARPAIKSVRSTEAVGVIARAMPTSRIVAIVRHPCAQVYSMMRGARSGKFELREKHALPIDQRQALACAAGYGIDSTAFANLPEAGRFAWAWVAFNEALERSLGGMPNVRTVVYEDLCARPIETSQELMAFAALAWHQQTKTFIRASINGRPGSGYYSVFQHAEFTVDRWRHEMPELDQGLVRSIARHSPVARYWSDLRL
jgi:hypothetical protein